MRKKHVTDSLLQIALMLSLVRRQVDDYLSVLNGQYSDNELTDVYLGATSAIAQTENYFSNWERSADGYVHPKNVDRFMSDFYARDIYLYGYVNRIVPTRIEAYALPELETRHNIASHVDTSQSSRQLMPHSSGSSDAAAASSHAGQSLNSNWNNNLHDSSNVTLHGYASDSDSGISNVTVGDERTRDQRDDENSRDRPGDELTLEDMTLIDVLWRQDMDMGVGKEMFDVTLRRELEKEQELELQKQQEKAQEDSKNSSESQLADLVQAVSFIVDDETGELIADVTSDDSSPATSDRSLLADQALDEAIEVLREHASPASTGAARDVTSSRGQQSRVFSRQNSLVDELTDLISSAATPTVSLSRQESIESRWHDVEDLIAVNFSSANSVAPPLAQQQQQPMPVMTQIPVSEPVSVLQPQVLTHVTPTNYSLPPPATRAESALLQNVTLGSDINDVNATEILAALDSSLLAAGAAAPPVTSQNDTPSALFGGMNTTDSALFPNVSITNSTNFLLDLLDENNMDTANDSDLAFHPAAAEAAYGPIKVEHQHHVTDAALTHFRSDDARSVGSSDAGSSNLTSSLDGDLSLNDSLSLEPLEGATGGSFMQELLNAATKDTAVKRQKYSFYTGASAFTTPPHSDVTADRKYSLKNNGSDDTNTSSSEYLLPAPVGDRRHVMHNHTYGAQPGQQPKERKCDVAARLAKNRPIVDTSRDEKKARKMQLPFSVEDIIHSPVETFNDMLTKYKLTEAQLQLMKDIRRRGKNKVAAQNCRKRKMEVIETLEEEVEKLRLDRDSLKEQHGIVDRERDKLRERYDTMYREVFNSLRDEHGQPYDPNEYTLQHTADGNVFLVPKNSTMESEPSTSSRDGVTRRGAGGDKKKKPSKK